MVATRDHCPNCGRPFPSAKDLTPAERRVLRGVARGLTQREIATELGISISTVKTHVGHSLLRLGVESVTDALLILHPRRRRAAS